MINNLFPYKLILHIFQLDEYNVGKLLQWVPSHFLTRTIENKKPLVWTSKAKAIYYLAIFLAILKLVLLTLYFQTPGFIVGVLLATQAYIFIILAYFILLPFEIYQKNNIKSATEKKLLAHPHLKIIGVTGSYGKTSVKEFLYQILRTQHKVLKTPESYNTPFGIAKVINLELDKSYEYFICEMGAYRMGEIKEICDMVHPQYGILTAINEQHLETFGSLENTTKGKFELIDSLPPNGIGIINGDNERIKKYSQKYNKQLISYGFTDQKFSIKHTESTTDGTKFTLILDEKPHQAKTRLVGTPNLHNILAAATASYVLGMGPQAIVAAIAQLQPVPHRLEIKEMNNMTLIDDAYNSNVDGFKEAINLLNTFTRPTVFVTPGIVDLGDKTFSIHKELGAFLGKVDYVILVGNSDRTQGLQDGIEDKKKIIKLESIKDVWGIIAELDLEQPVVLLENDLPDNY